MSVYYVQLFYVHIMLKKCQEHVNFFFVKDKTQNKKIYEDENTWSYLIFLHRQKNYFIQESNWDDLELKKK